MDSEKLENQLIALAHEHGLTIIEELGLTAPMYRLIDRKDAEHYLVLMYGYVAPVLH